MSKKSNTNEYTLSSFLLATHINSWFASLFYGFFDLSGKLGVYFLRQGIHYFPFGNSYFPTFPYPTFTFPIFSLATHINSCFASLIYGLFDLSGKLGVYYGIG